MSKSDEFVERRQFGRRWSNVHGWIRVEGRPRLPCIVRDFSEGGALLELTWPCQLPDVFRLSIDAIDFDIACERRHERSGAVGVRFISEAEAEVHTFYRWLETMTPSGGAQQSDHARLDFMVE